MYVNVLRVETVKLVRVVKPSNILNFWKSVGD